VKRLAKPVRREGGGVVVEGGCISCGADLISTKLPPVRVELPFRCPDETCGKEMAVTILNREMAGVRLPYGCSAWFDVRSSNLESVGRAGSDLVVRFKKGGVYLYRGGGDLLAPLVGAPSAGKFYHARVKSLGGVLLCAKYGCVEPAHRVDRQVLCETHLAR
jgi:hypothetical protein